MRILMLDNEFPPLGGGTGVVNYHLLQEMASYPDLWVDLVTSSRSRRNHEVIQFADQICIYKVPVDNNNIHHATNHELLRYAWRGLRQSRHLLQEQRYDLSFAFAGVPSGGISYALKRLHGLPYLVSLQGPDVPGFEARYSRLYPLLKPAIRRIWREAGMVTAISWEHRRLAQNTLPDLFIPVIPNAVDLHLFHPPAEQRANPTVSVLCVGRLIERKGQQFLLRAVAQLQTRDLHLYLVGTGDGEDELRRLAVELGIDDQVTFLGFVPLQEMPGVYQRADIFVLPSQNEGMSIALLEAMSSQLPVIVTNTGGTKELVRDNGIVVEWGNVAQLAHALDRLVASPQDRQRMGAQGREIAQRYSWREITHQYVDFCEQVAGQRPAIDISHRSKRAIFS